MRVSLPAVTLVMIETREHELARLAIEDTLKVIEPAEIIVFTDRPDLIHVAGHVRYVEVPDFDSKLGWCECYWHDVPPEIKTSHALMIQWDSWALDASMWRDEYLGYDYIGSPWWYKDGRNVGNSGFGMRSRRLMDYLLRHKDQYPVTTSAEDDLLSRTYRPRLEREGFRWAPEELARDFAFECIRPPEGSRQFGFHGIFNWPFVLDYEALDRRFNLARSSPYIVCSGRFASLGRTLREMRKKTA